MQVLLPCLRSDMAEIAMLSNSGGRNDSAPAASPRKFLTCCVRLSPEKEPERFLELVEALQAGGHLEALQANFPFPSRFK